MGFKDDLFAAARKIFAEQWTTKDKSVVPAPSDLGLGNDAGHFNEMTVLYADLNGSTAMVDSRSWQFSAEVYKSYLYCAAKIINAGGGNITAYDGDRIMAVFAGESKNSNAVTCAMKINFAIREIVNPAMRAQYPGIDFTVRHSVGIDVSEIHVARIGVRGDNDLVWIGRAANHAAKLTTLPADTHPLWISEAVHSRLRPNLKNFPNGNPVWESRRWTAMNDAIVYRSDAYMSFE